MSETNELLSMPCPRFELRWNKLGYTWVERECVYSLVIPLREHDIRSTDVEGTPREMFLEIGRTKVNGGTGDPPISEGKVQTPFRDGKHAIWDCEALGGHIPIVAICGDIASLVDERPNRQPSM